VSNEFNYHESVLSIKLLPYFEHLLEGVLLDVTLGGGGHSLGLLKITPREVKVIGLDQDDDALAAAKVRLAQHADRFSSRKGNFRNLPTIIEDLSDPIMGLVADLGVSSYQLTSGARGFSIMADGPLDMRMDQNSDIPTAGDLIDTTTHDELADILFYYGELPPSRRLSKELKRWRKEGRLETTADLKKLAEESLSRRGRIHPATKLFQALRIAVNQELESLEDLMDALPNILAPGGTAAIISFHSLEDRIVKHTLKAHSRAGTMEILTPKPLTPERDEQRANPRSRSAKLRIARRVVS
jgi:16S rRNA (cytosine1402-N4)-methyltransferase